MPATIDWASLTGQQHHQQPDTMLRPLPDDERILLHPDALAALAMLQSQATQHGFDLRVASGYRSFERQQHIWNSKAAGTRPLLDSAGCALDPSCLTGEQKLFAMLRWSAIPGCSRHHWGTDMDIYDAAAVPLDYVLQLTPEEVTGNGPFTPLHDWLDTVFAKPDSEFFRPYAVDTGGIAPERWHISWRPLSRHFEAALDEQRLLDWLMQQDIALRDEIRHHWPTIFQRFVLPGHTP